MPGRASTGLTDLDGVGLVQRVVSRSLGWIFREQRTLDQGIDGHVEVAVNGHGTGRLIAVQIKSGPSYFRRPVEGGWSFYYSARERQVWHGHVLPVMVLLVDVDRDIVYWQRIHPETERQTPKRYAVKVPANQTLDTAAEAWSLAASGTEQRAAERYDDNLDRLPPPVRRLIEQDGAVSTQATLVALHLAEGRTNPVGIAQLLLTAKPQWMQAATEWPWRALASFCGHHEAMQESADAWEVAAAQSSDERGSRLAVAALHLTSVDRDRAADLVAEARRHGGADVVVAIVEAMLEVPEGDPSPWRIDGVTAAAGSGVNTDLTVQRFLTENALRANDLTRAARHAERALALQSDDTTAMARVASICLRRSNTNDAQASDLGRASELLEAAVTQRRRWAGPTLTLLADLARVLILRGEHSAVLRRLLPEPLGTATPDEANDPALRRFALTAAHFDGDPEVVASIAARMTSSLEDQVAQVRLGLVDLTTHEAEALWAEELERAEAEHDDEAIVFAVYRLAVLGVDRSDRIRSLVRDGVLPPGADRLPRALSTYHRRPEEGLPLLRVLAAEDVVAAEFFVEALESAGHVDEVIEACTLAADRFHAPQFLTWRAVLLFRQAPDARANEALREALHRDERPSARLDLARRLADIASRAKQWAKVESIMAEAITYRTPPPDDIVWGLVQAQLANAGEVRAAVTIGRHHPQIRSEHEGRMWAHTMSHTLWDDQIAEEALDVAARFSDVPEVAIGLLTHLIVATRGSAPEVPAEPDDDADGVDDPIPDLPDERPVVRGELHRRAFELIESLQDIHGAATGVQILQGTSPEDSAAQLAEFIRGQGRPDLVAVADDVARGLAPAGMVAVVAGRSYTSALVQRAAGMLVAVAADDEEHQSELEVAIAAMGRPVIVDLSTLLVLSQLSSADAMSGQVSELVLARPARHDVQRATLEVQSMGGSPGVLGSNPVTGGLVFHQRTEEHHHFVQERTAAIEALTKRCSVRDVDPSTWPPDTSDNVRATPWLAAVTLAAQENLPLWCDDLVVRRYARGSGVETFSTMAMTDALRDRRLESAGTAEEIDEVIEAAAKTISELLAEYVVDVPATTEQLIDQARADNWTPAAAALAISRPAWWTGQPDPVGQLVGLLYPAIRGGDPDQLPGWQQAAMLGAVRPVALPTEQCQVLANLALLGWEPEPAFADLADGCRTARRIAATLNGVGDPVQALPAARVVLGNEGFIQSEQLVEDLRAELGEWDAG
ncbi:DUF4365 domain-containing protein [Amycolatopsis sp. Hca4]|uniref:DUF4365 domain-containing protein n=1 Tax=Amycolatopsis sp. Hca4 TaxID=2742131 RepID=UPI00159124B1|nr:DUF4365 domain-containing protein [Amycolatopsis sp. Hca4]QKV74085.1 DUF4365 domain-containing protein [Amycolatopsis sp. Hca4]